MKNKKLVGIITIRYLDLAGKESYSLFVEDQTIKDLITSGENALLGEISKLMTENGIEYKFPQIT